MAIQLTNKQLETLQPYTFERYISELVIHCDKNFPYLRKAMGEERLREVLRECVEKAERSSYTERGSVQFYIDMLVILGIGFETDPQYPWIKPLIEENKHLSEISQVSVFYAAVMEYLEKITGEHNKYLFAALEKVQRLTLDNFGVERDTYTKDMHALLYEIYPEKYQQTPQEDMTVLIRQGTTKAYDNYGFKEANQVCLIVLLMFFLGHEFDHDPFYQWAGLEKTNKTTEIKQDAKAKAEKLMARAQIWVATYVNNEQSSLTN